MGKQKQKPNQYKNVFADTRNTYNQNRFQSLVDSPEIVFTEVVLMEIQQFIGVMYGALVRFYLTQVEYSQLEQMKEDLIEVITSLTVSADLSDRLLLLCRASTREEEVLLQEKCNQYKNIEPEQLGISPYFTLNKSSQLISLYEEARKLQKQDTAQAHGVEAEDILKQAVKKKERFSISDEAKQLDVNDIPDDSSEGKEIMFQDVESSSSDEIELNKSKVSLDVFCEQVTEEAVEDFQKLPWCYKLSSRVLEQRIQEKPYSEVIDLFKTLIEHRTPIDKMRCITQVSNMIVSQIEKFWTDLIDENHVKQNQVTITAEDLPWICTYVTLQSGFCDLYAHLKLINQFSTNTLRQNQLGYNAATFEISLEMLLDLSKDQIQPAGLAVPLNGNVQKSATFDALFGAKEDGDLHFDRQTENKLTTVLPIIEEQDTIAEISFVFPNNDVIDHEGNPNFETTVEKKTSRESLPNTNQDDMTQTWDHPRFESSDEEVSLEKDKKFYSTIEKKVTCEADKVHPFFEENYYEHRKESLDPKMKRPIFVEEDDLPCFGGKKSFVEKKFGETMKPKKANKEYWKNRVSQIMSNNGKSTHKNSRYSAISANDNFEKAIQFEEQSIKESTFLHESQNAFIIKS